MIRILKILSRSITLEINNHTCYKPKNDFKVYLDDKFLGSYEKNIFTIYNLEANLKYNLTVNIENKDYTLDFETLKENMVFNIKNFGAKSEKDFDNTNAIQSAILSCNEGGVVYVPEGTYLTYPLFLKSNITIYLERGSVLQLGTNRNNFPVLPGVVKDEDYENEIVLATWEGNPLDSYASLITGHKIKNVNITGEGTLDGNGSFGDWWVNEKVKRGAWRPRVIFLNDCENISLVGINIINSPSWTVHPFYSKNINIIDVFIKNNYDSPNTDGINPESCEDVFILGCKISVGDDCIAIKSGKYYMSQYHYMPSKNIIIRNCLLERGHGAIVLGSEISSGVYNVFVEQCLMINTDRGLRIKTRRGRGEMSIINNIHFKNIVMDKVSTPFAVSMFYFCDPDGHSSYVRSKEIYPIDKFTPKIGSIVCENIIATNASVAGMFFYGLPEEPIKKIDLKNIYISFDDNAEKGLPALLDDFEPVKKLGLFGKNITELILDKVTIEKYEDNKMELDNISILKEDLDEQRKCK